MGVFLCKQYIDSSVPDTLLEAARIDGAGPMRIYWQIIMPIIKPALDDAATLRLPGHLGHFAVERNHLQRGA